MVLPLPQIAIGLLLISIGIVVPFDVKVNLSKIKSRRKKLDIWKIITLILSKN